MRRLAIQSEASNLHWSDVWLPSFEGRSCVVVPTDPLNWLWLARSGHDQIADAKVVDDNSSIRRRDARA
jgi:hypothetical protein